MLRFANAALCKMDSGDVKRQHLIEILLPLYDGSRTAAAG
jgi:hypothetical protein